MATEYTRDGLLAFLKEAAMAGHLNPATARARRNAAQELFTQLTEDEAEDLRRLDIDALAARCHKLQGGTARPEALNLYVGRLRSALEDYFSFLASPDSFVPVAPEQPTGRRLSAANTVRSEDERALENIRLGETRYRPDVLPVPIRGDRVVYLHGLPIDLSAAEAAKIIRVIEALVEETGEVR